MLSSKNDVRSGQMEFDETIPLVPISDVVLFMPDFSRRNIECLVSGFQDAQGPLNILIEVEINFFHDTDFADYLSLDQEGTAGKE